MDYAHPLTVWDPAAPDWMLMGIEQRTRFEIFDDNYDNGVPRDEPFSLRSRAFLGVRELIDPLRFGFEFQDSRQFNATAPPERNTVDENDILQAYAELYFGESLGLSQPLSFQFGRLANDYIDRRLRSRNGFRNTCNAFDGFRIRAGNRETPWELEFFAVQPVDIRTVQPNRSNEEQWFYGVVGAWRGFAPLAWIEPYYFILDEDNKGWNAEDADLHTPGVHVYGDIGSSGFDYDLDVAFQYGNNLGLSQRAFATHAEIGYTFAHPWHPRVAFWVNYASGDRDPNDGIDNTFDRLFGSSNGHYGFLDYFIWSNMIQPSVQLSASPTKSTRLNSIYRTVWLASDTDAWARADRQDPTGQSGDFVGTEIDLFMHHDISQHLSIEIGYAHFFPGAFVRNTGDSPDSDRFYVQTILRF